MEMSDSTEHLSTLASFYATIVMEHQETTMKGYCVFDLETTVVQSFKRFANPFDPRNKIIAASMLLQGEDPCVLYDKVIIYQEVSHLIHTLP